MLRILKTANFRLTLIYATIFGASVFMLGFIMFYHMTDMFETQIKNRILSEANQLLIDYRQDGLDELRHDIREAVETTTSERLYYYLQSPTGKIIFDDIESLPQNMGWHHIKNGHCEELILYMISLDDGYSLGIASNTHIIHALKGIIKSTFTIASIITFFLAAIGGFVLSRKFLARIDRISRTAQSIGRGQLTQRITIHGTNDDFDRLGMTINAMLDRIEALISNIKQVSNNIAHDLRTPLGHIRQKLENLKQSKPSEEAIDEIIASLDDVLEIFTTMLKIAEIESGQMKANFAVVNLSEIIDNIIESYKPIIEDSQRELQFHIQPNIFLGVDKGLITQLIVNLVENSILYTPVGSIITITLIQKEGIILTIADNGDGIDEKDLPIITRPFYRGDKTRQTKGNGLGLSLVKVIAELHNAKLEFYDNQSGLGVKISF